MSPLCERYSETKMTNLVISYIKCHHEKRFYVKHFVKIERSAAPAIAGAAAQGVRGCWGRTDRSASCS